LHSSHPQISSQLSRLEASIEAERQSVQSRLSALREYKQIYKHLLEVPPEGMSSTLHQSLLLQISVLKSQNKQLRSKLNTVHAEQSSMMVEEVEKYKHELAEARMLLSCLPFVQRQQPNQLHWPLKQKYSLPSALSQSSLSTHPNPPSSKLDSIVISLHSPNMELLSQLADKKLRNKTLIYPTSESMEDGYSRLAYKYMRLRKRLGVVAECCAEKLAQARKDIEDVRAQCKLTMQSMYTSILSTLSTKLPLQPVSSPLPIPPGGQRKGRQPRTTSGQRGKRGGKGKG